MHTFCSYLGKHTRVYVAIQEDTTWGVTDVAVLCLSAARTVKSQDHFPIVDGICSYSHANKQGQDAVDCTLGRPDQEVG